MALAGTLKDFSLADIFQLIGLQKKTGVLTLKNDREEARILFMNGLVVGADTNNQRLENRLGHVLVKSNRISEDELKIALSSQGNTLQRLGQVLVQKGFIKPEDLRDSLQTQTTQIIYRMFRWEDGEYHFQQERFVDYDQENFKPITSESILMEGVRMLDEWPMIERVIPTFDVIVERTTEGRDIKLRVEDRFSIEATGEDSFNSLLEGVMADSTIDDIKTSPSVNLSHNQELILKLIEGPSQVQDLIDRSGMNEFETCRALYDLFGMGLVNRVREDETASIKVIEKEANIPVWIPASLVGVIALFSFFLGWNPLNDYVPMPMDLNRNAHHFQVSSSYQLDRITDAIDLFYIKQGHLPSNLEKLALHKLLAGSDLVDAFGRGIRYEPHLNESWFSISIPDPEGRNAQGLTRKKSYAGESAGY